MDVVLRGAGGVSAACAACGVATLVSALASEQRFRGDGLERMNDIKTLYRMKEAALEEEKEGFKGKSDFVRATVDADELVQMLRGRVLSDWLHARAGAAAGTRDDRAMHEDSFFRVERWQLDVRRSTLGDGAGSAGLGCYYHVEKDDIKKTAPLTVGTDDACVARIARRASPSTLYSEHGHDADVGSDVVNLAVAKRLQMRRDYSHFTYVASLPQRTHAPLEWTYDELDDALLGTTLYDAVIARRTSLRRQFDSIRDAIDDATWQRLTDILKIQQSENAVTGFVVNGSMEAVRHLSSLSLFRALRNALMSAFDYRCEFNDYLWAAAIYRSRAMHVPDMIGGGASVVLAPGIDFVNHQRGAGANAYWRVDIVDDGADHNTSGDKSIEDEGDAKTVRISLYVKPDRIKAVCGDTSTRDGKSETKEITIDYGDKSNEELLFLHGFCDASGIANDRLMIHVPLPPTRLWGEGMQRRMKIVQMLQVSIQFFIRHRDVPSTERGTWALLRSFFSWRRNAAVPSWCTDDMLNVMRVFTLNDEEIAHIENEAAVVIERLHNATHASDEDDSSSIDAVFLAELQRLLWSSKGSRSTTPRRERLEMEQRAIRLLRELLTTKLNAMVAGTGSIEDDERVLGRIRSGKPAPREGGGAKDGNINVPIDDAITLHATVYRKAQKEIASRALASLS